MAFLYRVPPVHTLCGRRSFDPVTKHESLYQHDGFHVVVEILGPARAQIIRNPNAEDYMSMPTVAPFRFERKAWNEEPECDATPPAWLLHAERSGGSSAHQSGIWDSGRYYYRGYRGWIISNPVPGSKCWWATSEWGSRVLHIEGLNQAPQPLFIDVWKETFRAFANMVGDDQRMNLKLVDGPAT